MTKKNFKPVSIWIAMVVIAAITILFVLTNQLTLAFSKDVFPSSDVLINQAIKQNLERNLWLTDNSILIVVSDEKKIMQEGNKIRIISYVSYGVFSPDNDGNLNSKMQTTLPMEFYATACEDKTYKVFCAGLLAPKKIEPTMWEANNFNEATFDPELALKENIQKYAAVEEYQEAIAFLNLDSDFSYGVWDDLIGKELSIADSKDVKFALMTQKDKIMELYQKALEEYQKTNNVLLLQ